MELQAQLLRSFLAQFANKEVTSAYEDGAYAVEFLKLKRQSTKYRTEKTFSTKAAEKQENVKKNRYKDIVPFDHSRVKLSLNTSKNDTDYINANFIRGVWGPTEYIATQGPLPHTVLDFWRMLWEYNVKVVVMACREFEMGRKKCERYWPETMVDVFVCEPFKIYCESEENKGDYLIRILKVTYKNSSRTLKQLHYMNWPDHGVPDSIPPILEILQDMRMFQEQNDVPICIHCSAGCGRTGALCAIDYTWNLLKKHMIPEDFSIYDLVQDMRTQRPSIVQTKEQYELVYRVIQFLFENYLQMMDSNPRKQEVLDTPPQIPIESDSEVSDFNGSDDEPEPVKENRPHPCYDLRHPEKEVHTEFSNHLEPSAVSQPLPPHLRPPTPPGPKYTPADVFNDMKNWAKSKIYTRVTATSSQLQKADLGCQKSQIPSPVQKTDVGYQKPQISDPFLLQNTDVGCQKPQTVDPFLLQETEPGHQKPHILEPPFLQQTDLGYQNSQILKPLPLQSTVLVYQKSQILESSLPQPTDLVYRKSQILEPPPLQPTDLGYRKSQILEPPPLQPTDLGYRKAQIPKPPRHQKTDLGCRMSQTFEPPPLQETDLGYRKSQILQPPLLQLTDIEYQNSQILEPPPIQQTDLEPIKYQMPKPPRPQKADPGCPKPQIPETATTNQAQQNDILKSNNPFRPTVVQESSPHQTNQAEISNDGTLLQAPSICLTVEDPYFGPDSPMSTESGGTEGILSCMKNPCFTGPSLALKTQTIEPPMQDKISGVATPKSDEESPPPPLPERTPESFIMAEEEPPQILTPTLLQCTTDSTLLNDTDTANMGDKGDMSAKDDTGNTGSLGNMGVDQNLMLVIPPDNLSIKGGSPPSPAPPLPERTPESFVMADDADLLRNAVQEKPQETVLRVGKSSEWSGNSNLDVPDFKRSWSRSKSLRARLSLNVPLNIQPFAPLQIPSEEPPKSLTPPLPERTPDSFVMEVSTSETPVPLTPPLPRRTRESFIVVTEEGPSNSDPCQSDTVQQKQRLGTSSEWLGNSQPRTFIDVMTRSKSVKVKSSKQECLSVAPQPDPHGGATAEPVLSTAQNQTSVDSRHPAVEQPEKLSLPKKCRTKSLKLWKGKPKSKEAPGTAPAPPNHGAATGFIFSFGTRFGKPKGPRNQPETWV